MKQISGYFNKYQMVIFALAISLSGSKGLAQGDDGSLNDMWNDQSILEKPDPSKTKSTKSKKPLAKPLDTDTNFKIVTPDASSDDLSESSNKSDTENKTASPDKTKSDLNNSSTNEANEEKIESPSSVKENKVIKPLCTVKELKESTFVKSGGWPRVGPFKSSPDESTILLDDYNNKIELKANGDKISSAKLKLANISNNESDLLTLQMSTDFFLEALGAASGKIANFNSIFSEKQSNLTSGQARQLTLNAGPLEVSIEKKDSDSNKSDVLISVVNTELVDVVKKPEPKVSKAADIASTDTGAASTTSEDTGADSIASKDTGADTVAVTDDTNASAIQNSKDTIATSLPATKPTVSVLDKPVSFHLKNYDKTKEKTSLSNDKNAQNNSPDELKQRFTELIETWQSVKRRAVKNRQTQNLFDILGGKSLTRQSQAIKWLLDNHKYYEMTPNSMNLERYIEITPKKKYEVVAKISERRKFIDANKMRILKDTTTTYTVSYVVENIRGQWLITDSKVLN